MPEFLTLGVDALPLANQRLKILDDGFLGGTLGCGTDDDTHILRGDLGDDALEPATFAFGELAAHAGHAAGRHEHQEAAGERDLRSQAGALVSDRILGDLHEHRVAGLERQLDAARLAFETRGVPVDLTGVEHAVTGLADVHESGFHAGQHVLYTAEVDVAHGLHFLDVGDVMLDQDVVFHHGNLGVMFLLAHHHEAIDVLTACEEILLHELALAATLTTIVTASLFLGLKTGGAFHIGDLIDVLLLAGAASQLLIVLLITALGILASAAATATAGNGLLLVIITVALIAIIATATGIVTIVLGGLAVVVGSTGLVAGATATATAGTGAGGVGLFVVLLFSNRRVRNVIQLEVFLNLLDFSGSTALLGVQAARTARTARIGLAISVEIILSLITATIIAAVIAVIVIIMIAVIAAARPAGTRRAFLVIGLILTGAGATRRAGTLFAIIFLIITIITSHVREHRLLEQQGSHRLATTGGFMPCRQRINHIQHALIGVFFARVFRRTAAASTTGRAGLVIAVIAVIRSGTTATHRTIAILIGVVDRSTAAR